MLTLPHLPRTARSELDLANSRPGTVHRILWVAVQEWSYFGGNYDDINFAGIEHSGHVQTDPGYYQRVGEYWKYGSDTQGLDGKDKNYWSATFISYVMRKAGVSDHDFHRSARHSKYIHVAMQNRVRDVAGAKFVGRRLTEYRPKEGDLICNSRSGANITFDAAINNDDYDGHCDIVIYVRPGEIGVIGGNVSGTSAGHRTVGLRTRKLSSGGYLLKRSADPFFAILENRLPLK
jgi:hypothetical protein